MATIKLVKMNEKEYMQFRSRSISDYAADKVEAGTWSTAEAALRSEEEFNQALPDGLETKDAFIFTIQDQTENITVGYVWFNLMERNGSRFAFIMDILIFEEYQGRGYGKETMAAIDDEVRKLGLKQISLHVFGHNERAFRLYQKMGYEVTDIQMTKKL
ncbi:GNAT family N-acetyltransferase [Paenibacillus puldeungensis]|uniref:GNAT family N-acetyltransferase n=1 Tax=Paenibacillus puldeungensis TaxID=696536 RepID=A0ABW3S5S7_9BACL